MPHAHTPVKWIVELANVGDDPLDSVEHVIVTEGNREIADCGRAAHKANHTRARLIAAAPEMLAMLEKAKAALYNVPEVGQKYDQQHSHTHAQACLDIEQLITRATGRERGNEYAKRI